MSGYYKRNNRANISKNNSNNNEFVDISSGVPRRKKSNKKAKIKKAVLLTFSILFLIFGTGMLWANYLLSNLISYTNPSINATKNTETDDDGNIFEGRDTSLLSDPDIFNIMLFGEDTSDSETGRSDTAILLSIDMKHKKLKMASFQRDTFISIPGYSNAKFNAAYSYGGAPLSVETVESNFGIQIDKFAVVNFTTFKEIIDVLGGIDIELTAEESSYINYQSYRNNQTDNGYELDEIDGIAHLNGRQALWYARNRGIDGEYDSRTGGYFYSGGDDFSRTARQRNLIDTVVKNTKDASLNEIIQIIQNIGPHIGTNFTIEEVLSIAPYSLEFLSYETEEFTVPPNGTWAYGSDDTWGSIIAITDWDQCCLELAKFIYEDAVQVEEITVQEDYNNYDY